MNSTPSRQQWLSAYQSARAGRFFFEQPLIHVAVAHLAEEKKSATFRRHCRMMEKSIPELRKPSESAVDTARRVVSERAGLYALFYLRRQGCA